MGKGSEGRSVNMERNARKTLLITGDLNIVCLPTPDSANIKAARSRRVRCEYGNILERAVLIETTQMVLQGSA
jgi:hypothetical protein